MKNSLKKVCILSLILITISTIFLLVLGKTYTAKFIINDKDNYTLNITNNTGEVTVLEEKKLKDNYLIKVKAKKSGIVYLVLDNNSFREEKVLYIHKSMIITDNNYFGKSNGAEIIPVSLSIILIYLLYSLIKQYHYSKKENLYQYQNIFYLGIIIFLSLFTISNIFSSFNYNGLYETINKTINSMSLVSFLMFPLAIITFILVTISNIRLIRKEGLSLKNLLGLFLGIFICILTILPNTIYGIIGKSGKVNIYNLNSPGPYIYNFIEVLIYLVIAYLECILIGTIIIAIKSVKNKPTYNKDYIIILGCKIRKDGSLTPLLKGRVDRAITFRNEQLKTNGKDLIFIASGGKGNDETISESIAIKNYLLENGINEKNILLETKSKNTYENIKFSYQLIKEKNAHIAFSTTNYHVLRAGLIATSQGLIMEGIGSKTKAYFWINAFIREFIGTLYSERKKHLIVFSLIVIIIIMMIGITYFANNI